MAKIGDLGSLRVGVELPIKDWTKNYGKLTADVKKYPKTTDKALDRAGKAWEKHAGAIKGASLGMVAFGTATVAALGFAVKAAGDFQQSMVNTQSVVGATSGELQELTFFAREMGKQTVFSAKESADAMYSLGSAGLSTKEIMDSLKGTLNLAAATQSELAFTSRVVASTLSQYGLDASEAGRISNVFTATISASQATMDKLATSMALVGPVARSVGMSLEETTGILGSLFNAGLDASTAGTSLRQSMAQLLKPTDDAKETLKRLKVETLDSGGELRNLTDIIRDLETSGLSAADALTIFGVRAGPGMLALVSKGADAIEDLTEKVTGTNKAAEIAALQVDTFQGQIKLLNSAVSELKITIGNQLLPVLADYTTKLADVINKTSDWAAANPRLASTLTKVGGVAGIAALGLGGIGLAAPGIVKAGKALKFLAKPVVALAALDAILVLWARKRIWDAATQDVDLAALRTKILTERQEDLQLALEQIGGALNVYEQTGSRTDATLQDLGISADKLNRALKSNFIATDNASRVYAGLFKNLEKTSTETAKLAGTFEKLGPPEEDAAKKTARLAKEMGILESAVNKLGTTLLTLPSAIGVGTTQIQREADKAVAIIKQRTTFEKDWITTNGIIQLGLVEKNVDERLGLLDDETKEEQKIRLKAQKEDRKLRDKASKEPLFIPGTLTKRDTNEIIGRGKTLADAIDDLQTKREAKNVLGLKKAIDNTDRFGKEQDNIAERTFRNEEILRAENSVNAKKAMVEWRNSWGAVIGDVETNFAGLYASIIDPSIEVGWKNFFGRFKDIAIQTASDILADRTIKALFSFGSGLFGGKGTALSGGGTLADKIFGTAAAAGAATISPTASTAIGSISLGTKLGTIASAVAPAIIPIALAAAGFGIFAALMGGGKSAQEKALEAEAEFKKRGVKPAIALRRLTDEEKEALKEGIQRRRPAILDRRRPLIPRESGPLAARIAASSRIRIRSIVDGEVAIEPPPVFVPRRPQGTDRFGRPLAATPAMAPRRQQAGDVNIEINVVVQGQDIRDMDIAEWQRIFRDNLQPAAEAEGQRFVRSDNLMVS